MIKKKINIEQRILAKMKKASKGTVFFPENFSRLAGNAALRKALQRLTENESIVRVAHGIYVIPKESDLTGKIIPGAEDIAATIAKRDKVRIVPTGVQALHLLGLSTQVPMNSVYLTDGAARTIKVRKQTIKLKRTTPKNLLAKGEISALVIQALKSIGKNKVTESELNKIITFLTKEKKENVLNDLKLAPAWIADIMKNALKPAL